MGPLYTAWPRLITITTTPVCVECGVVEEFSIAAVERMLSDISVEICCRVVDHFLEFYVRCGFCPAGERN